jgi:hypothetical protein
MLILFLYAVLIGMLSYFILEKKGKVEDATIFVLTSLALSAVINYYDISSFYINENSFFKILGLPIIFTKSVLLLGVSSPQLANVKIIKKAKIFFIVKLLLIQINDLNHI